VIVLDHPTIRNCERTGWPDGHEPPAPVCPVCGGECSEIYHDKWFNLLGCDLCVTSSDAWEVNECFPERNEE
jgi:hypothetical protein